MAVILMEVNFEYRPLIGLLNLGFRLLNLEMGFTRAISAAISETSSERGLLWWWWRILGSEIRYLGVSEGIRCG